MKIIEKKCPGCGADVKFDENAKKGVCEYCKKEFLIEKDPQEEFLLSMNDFSKDVMKHVSSSFKVSHYLFIFVFIVVFISIILMFTIGFSQMHNNNNHGVLNEVENISSFDYSYIDNKAHSSIEKLSYGDEDFRISGLPQRVKEFLLVKDKTSIYIPIYKTIYTSWPNKENKYTIYIPVKFNNVKTDGDDIDLFNLGEGQIDADEYYFNLEHSSSSKGYQSLDELNEKYIKPLSKGYTVKEK